MRSDATVGAAPRQGISARILRENHEWLKLTAAKQERSANWLLDKLITEARLADMGVESDRKH